MTGFLARQLVLAIGWFPLPVIHSVAGALGSLAARIPNAARRVVQINLGLAFPDLSPFERRRLLRRVMPQMARTVLELGALWSWKPRRVLALVHGTSGEEAVRRAIETGRGVILAGLHLGPWELVLAHCSANYAMTTLYRPLRIREQDTNLRRARERCGATMVPTGRGAVRLLLEALRRGEMVGIAPDQGSDQGARVFVPFFGRPACTLTLLPRLAAEAGALVVYAYGERLPLGRGYHLHFETASEQVYSPDLETSARAMNRDIERCIREFPDLYLWAYKRFRIQPPGTTDPYKNPR